MTDQSMNYATERICFDIAYATLAAWIYAGFGGISPQPEEFFHITFPPQWTYYTDMLLCNFRERARCTQIRRCATHSILRFYGNFGLPRSVRGLVGVYDAVY